MKEEEKEDSSQSKRSGPTLRISTDISPQPQTISSISSPSPSASSPNSPPSRQIAPLGSSRRPRSKTPTQREPNPNSPSFSNQSFNESSPNSFRRGRNRPKTWSGRSQHSIERRPIWNPSNLSPNRSSNTNSNSPISPKSFVRSLTLEESSDNSRSRDRDREIERGRSLSRSPIKPRGEEIDREALSSEEEETARQKIVLSNLAISIDNMDHQSSSILSNLHPNESGSDRESSRNSSRGRGRGIGGSRLGPIPIPSHQEFHHSHQHQHDHSQHHDGYSHSHEHPPGSALGNEGTVEDRVDSQDERDQEKERAHFLSVLEAFDQYLPYCLAANSSRRRSLYALPRAHQALLRDVGSTLPSPTLDPDSDSNSKSQQQQPQPPLRGVKSRLDEIDDRIRRNADVLNEIVKDSRGGFLGEEESATKSKSDEDSEVENISRGQEEVERGRSSFVDQAADSSPEEDHPSNLRQSRSKSRSSNSKGRDSSKGKAKQTSNEPEENSTTEASSSGLPSLPSTSNAEDKASPNFDNSKSERSARHEARKQARERLKKARAAEYGVDKIRSTLKQLVRDWSSFGSLERELAYGPIIQTIEERFGSIPENERNLVRILVPGAGLGRLAFELAWRGFSTQGNEFSFYMLLASHFVLNKTKKVDEHLIYPYIHSSSNWRNAQDMLQEVRFPDVKPSELPHQVDFSMVAGEFIEVYSSPTESQKWDVVATCFFIDTARNFIRYLEVFNHLLPLGGLWINLGPLLWHYEGGSGSGSDDNESKKKLLEDDISIELTLEEVLDCTRRMGFEIEEQRSLPEMPYTGNPSGMLCYQYKPEYWVARKVAHVQFAGDA